MTYPILALKYIYYYLPTTEIQTKTRRNLKCTLKLVCISIWYIGDTAGYPANSTLVPRLVASTSNFYPHLGQRREIWKLLLSTGKGALGGSRLSEVYPWINIHIVVLVGLQCPRVRYPRSGCLKNPAVWGFSTTFSGTRDKFRSCTQLYPFAS